MSDGGIMGGKMGVPSEKNIVRPEQGLREKPAGPAPTGGKYSHVSGYTEAPTRSSDLNRDQK